MQVFDFHRLWEDLNQIEKEEFGDKINYKDFQSYMNNEDGVLFEMANLRGNDIKLHHRIPFSLYISSKKAVHDAHGIRVKVLWNPSKMTDSPDGQLELHGDYKYTRFSHKYSANEKEKALLREYCRKYKVFFAAIWEGILDASDFVHYQEGLISFKELLTTFDLKGRDYYNVNHCTNLEDLERCVRENKIYNMND